MKVVSKNEKGVFEIVTDSRVTWEMLHERVRRRVSDLNRSEWDIEFA